MDRLAMLEKMVAAQPDQPFPAYGLAMEYRKLGRLEEAEQVLADRARRYGRAELPIDLAAIPQL